MSGSLGLSRGNAPVGYTTPKFPSLSFHLTETPYTSPLLFYSWDIYVFTVYWHLIFSVGFHVAIVAVAHIIGRRVERKYLTRFLWTLLIYIALGAFYGFAIGSFIGLLLGTVYRAGALHMTTWVPFTWGLLVMVFAIITSYEISAITS